MEREERQPHRQWKTCVRTYTQHFISSLYSRDQIEAGWRKAKGGTTLLQEQSERKSKRHTLRIEAPYSIHALRFRGPGGGFFGPARSTFDA